MKVLIVAYPYSVHTQRWIRQLRGKEWEVHLWYPSYAGQGGPISLVKSGGTSVVLHAGSVAPKGLEDSAKDLLLVLRDVAPDVVHTLALGWHAFVVETALRKMKGQGVPAWIVSDWGTELSFSCRRHGFAAPTRAVLKSCDYFWAECARDVRLAREWGFRGTALPVTPVGGGFDVDRLIRGRAGLPSRRKMILVKGSHGPNNLAVHALAALERCSELLAGYRVGIFGATMRPASAEIPRAVKEFRDKTGIPAALLPQVGHAASVLRHGRARISIGLSKCDGISTSLLEAMIMGSYPIQADTACASEWIRDGVTGSIVSAERPSSVEAAIREAILDDAKVDRASLANLAVVRRRLDERAIRERTLRSYRLSVRRGRRSGPSRHPCG